MSGFNPARKATPRGQMSSSQNSGPAVMLMPPEIRSTFMPNPPLEPKASVSYRRRNQWSGVAQYMVHMETTSTAPERIILPTPKSIREQRKKTKMEHHQLSVLQPLIEQFRNEQKDCGGEYKGMNCYNTLFIGRLSYEVTERKLLREMEAFGPIKDLHIIAKPTTNNNATTSSESNNNNIDTKRESHHRGYAFVEYEHEEDMKRAYRAMDGVRLEGREIVVDVERGHTVPDFVPRRLGGGLGGTRLGGRDINVVRPGRYDPHQHQHRVTNSVVLPSTAFPPGGGGGGMGRGLGGPSQMGSTPYGPGPMYGGGNSGPPSRQSRGGDDSSRYNNSNDDRNKRRRSRSPPDQRYGGGNSRRPRF